MADAYAAAGYPQAQVTTVLEAAASSAKPKSPLEKILRRRLSDIYAAQGDTLLEKKFW